MWTILFVLWLLGAILVWMFIAGAARLNEEADRALEEANQNEDNL